MFSSGTTGPPKCIVHGAGGTLLEHVKEHLLHCDLRRGDRLFFQTSCAWMMWNWQLSALASGAEIVLFEGRSRDQIRSGGSQPRRGDDLRNEPGLSRPLREGEVLAGPGGRSFRSADRALDRIHPAPASTTGCASR